jgi:hypothetical protein
MKFYQVNQDRTFEREFEGRYLCSPNGSWGGWRLMQELQSGDILFHYNSTHGAVLGISRVIDIGQHKGVSSRTACVIQGTQCIQYTGWHLSEDDFSVTDREHYRQKYSSYLEVHTVPLHKENLGQLLLRTPQKYLVRISDREARRLLEKWGIRLDSLT